jgi:hypothetical protein
VGLSLVLSLSQYHKKLFPYLPASAGRYGETHLNFQFINQLIYIFNFGFSFSYSFFLLKEFEMIFTQCNNSAAEVANLYCRILRKSKWVNTNLKERDLVPRFERMLEVRDNAIGKLETGHSIDSIENSKEASGTSKTTSRFFQCGLRQKEGGRLEAFAFSWYAEETHQGRPCQMAVVLAENPLLPELVVLGERLGLFLAGLGTRDTSSTSVAEGSSNAEIIATYGTHGLACSLAKHGFHVNSVTLLGNVSESLEKLKSVNHEHVFEAAGLKLTKLAHVDEIEKVIALSAATYEARFGWFLVNPEYQNAIRSELQKTMQLELETRHQFLLWDKNTGSLVGYFGGIIEPSPQWGKRCGLSFTLNKSLHGKGLARALYKVLLDSCQKEGGDVYFGGTSQPGVLKIAKELGRVPLEWVFAKQKHFETDYFVFGD